MNVTQGRNFRIVSLLMGIGCLAVGPLAATSSLTATPPETSGSEIMVKVNARPQPRDMSAILNMTLINAQGSTRNRVLQQYQADFGGIEKKMMFFLEPADVRGTAFMNWSYDRADRPDDQWLFLPALKKVKRISSEGRGDAFMGSDFSYEDLSVRQPSLDNHTLLRSETLEGTECFVVESIPKDRKSSLYSKTVSWIRSDTWTGSKREYYDMRGVLLKTLSIRRNGEIGGYLMILETEMKNVQTGHSTRMSFSSVKLDSGIKETIFSERSLEKGVK